MINIVIDIIIANDNEGYVILSFQRIPNALGVAVWLLDTLLQKKNLKNGGAQREIKELLNFRGGLQLQLQLF